MLANYLAIVLALAGIIVLVVSKVEADGLDYLANTSLPVANLVIACFCTILSLVAIVITVWHLSTTWRAPWYGHSTS